MPSPSYRVQNPVTNEVIETFDFATDAEIEAALNASAEAFTEWSARPMAERSALVAKAADLLEERKEELAAIAAEEMGKAIDEGVEEVDFCAAILRYYAEHGEEFTRDQEIPTASSGTAIVRRLPIGPLLGIMPWNFPYYQIIRFAAPNLVLGNTILLKGAEICPRSALAVQQAFDDAGLPAGVYRTVFASHEQISTIIAHPIVQGVSLTGSERAGSIISEQAGKALKKSVLELGGSDPYIVLDSGDVAKQAQVAWAARMYNTGQACNSNKRMIVMDDIYDDFVAELVRLAKNSTPTTPDESGAGTYRPLSSREAAEKLRDQIERAVAAGATLHAGGELSETGAYISPAVLTDIPVGSDIYYEEFFGPVAAVFKATSDDEAVELANNTPFGLGGAVFSDDTARAESVARRVNAGMTTVNVPLAEGPEMPFGGVKRSGFGRELGPLGMDEFVNKQVYFVHD